MAITMGLNNLEIAYNRAIQVFQRADEGIKAKNDTFKASVEKFGHEWILPRESFLSVAVLGIITTIHEFAIALFDTAFQIPEFSNMQSEDIKGFFIDTFRITGDAAIITGKSLLGIIAPSLPAVHIPNWINGDGKKVGENQEEINVLRRGQ